MHHKCKLEIVFKNFFAKIGGGEVPAFPIWKLRQHNRVKRYTSAYKDNSVKGEETKHKTVGSPASAPTYNIQ